MPFAIVAAASWAGVMYMFRHRGERLQAGMGNSMRKFESHSHGRSVRLTRRISVPRLRGLDRLENVIMA